jgi:predicted DNA-binding WGR domain protein
MVSAVSKYTAQTIIRYFDHEKAAVDFINMITSKNSKELQD